MRILSALLLSLGLCLIAGCGGGGSSLRVTNSSGNSASNSHSTGQKAATGYTVTDLGAANDYYYYGYYFDGLNRGAAVQINDLGQVVSGTGPNAIVWRNGATVELNTNWSNASDLNNNNQIVGQANVSSNSGWHAVLWQNGSPVDLGALSTQNYAYSQACGINDTGAVVGVSSTDTGMYYSEYHAFVWQNGQMTDLGTLGGGYSTAADINHAGQVVGWSTLNVNGAYTWYPVHAFVWQNGMMTDLGTLPGGTASDASAINAAGVIVGSSDTPPQGLYEYRTLHAVAWVNEVIQDLGTLGGPGSIAFDINDAGQIVGAAD
ncbi:MAG TPA: DUF3466 family protein, partial [Chthonomonadaceae bacterium]|nr:DUF3466 family protein [Chthonomonadaceae bacterium]